jgi:ribosomal protein S6
MTKNKMPATEAGERTSYEFAFHVLPTVAEGEVPAVFEKLKTALTKAGVEIIDEEAPQRFDLAYEIIKYLEGRNRKFTSAYFGWVRFTATPDQVASVGEVAEGISELLRYLLIKLNKTEEAHPFRFHEALTTKQIETVEASEDEEESSEKDSDDVDEATEDTEEEEKAEETK